MSIKIPLIKKNNLEKTFVIGIEGLNGVGKTTLTRNIQNNNTNVKCDLCVPELFTKNKEIKSFMLFEAAATTSALYYLSGICEAFHVIKNESYSNVVLDRSIWSTFAAAKIAENSLIKTQKKSLKKNKNFIEYLKILDTISILLIQKQKHLKMFTMN